MRKHVGWYITGMPGATTVRRRANEVGSCRELDELLHGYRDCLERGEDPAWLEGAST
jgi:tRNA-dihydrouridine synthase